MDIISISKPEKNNMKKVHVQIEIETESNCNNWMFQAIQENLYINEQIKFLNIIQLDEDEVAPILVKLNSIGQCPHVLNYHDAYDKGYRATSYPCNIASVSNNYIGNGVAKINNIWTEVPIGSWLLFNRDELISIVK
jgi:hypothetical protein